MEPKGAKGKNNSLYDSGRKSSDRADHGMQFDR